MTITIINYYIHLILQSKHKLLIILFIYGLFYITLKNVYSVECMTENNDPPTIAEAKEPVRPSEQVIALRRNIQAYAGSIASQLEEKDNLISSLKNDIEQITEEKYSLAYELTKQYEYNEQLVTKQYQHNEQLRTHIKALRDENTKLQEVFSSRIEELEKEITTLNEELFEEFRETNTLTEELNKERNTVNDLLKTLARKEKIIKVLNKYNEI